MHDMSRTRDVTLKSNGKGYILEVGERTERLTPSEADELFCQLLKTLPGIHDAVKLAWDHRLAPEIKLIGYYGLDKELNIVVNQWLGEVVIGSEIAFRTTKFMPRAAVIEALRELYGCDITVKEEVTYEVSRGHAEKRKAIKQAEAYAASMGMTMTELWAEVAKMKKEGRI